jgi:putative N6-adenine-specific DNA methylase
MARHAELFAVCPPGLEPLVADELKAAGFRAIREDTGGVTFKGHVGRANRVLACPTRILQRIGRFNARSFEEFETNFKTLDLMQFGGLTPSVTCKKSKLYHTGAVEERVAEWVTEGPTVLHIRIVRGRCTVSVDASGERLHRRGWRLEMGRAPIRETLAAALLRFAGWTPGTALVDPMCGSGTFVIEAACRATGLVPGMNRSFASDAWSGPGRQDPSEHTPTTIIGADIDPAIIEVAQRNAGRASVAVDLRSADARTLEAPSEEGLLICNPPYGQRVNDGGAYHVLRDLLANGFKGWTAGVLCSSSANYKTLGRRSQAQLRVNNGGIKLDFHVLPPKRSV